MADINEILLRITGDDDDAKRVLEGLIAAMEAVDKLEADPEVALHGEDDALSGLAEIASAVEALSATEADPSVDVHGVPEGIAEVAVLAASLEALPDNINVDVDVKRGALETANAGMRGLASAGEQVQGVIGGLVGGFSKIGVNIGSFSARLGPLVAIVGALALSIGVTLVAALGALAASAALAATALAAMAVALAAAMAPIALIAIPALLSFGKILKVLKQEQTEAGNAAREKARADQEAVVYSRQHADASRELAQAVQAEKDAVVPAMREMQDAIEAVSDSFRSLQSAKLSEERAKLNTKRAAQDLKNFRKEVGALGTDFDGLFKKFTDVNFKGDTSKIIEGLAGAGVKVGAGDALDLQDKILALKEARQQEKDATDGVSDAERNLSRARQDALKFQRDGIAASDQYRAAQDRVAEATRNLARVEADRRDQLKQQKLTESVSQVESLNSSEKDLLKTTKDLIAAFKDAFGPGIQAFIKGIVDGLKKIGPAMGQFKGPLTDLGTAMGAALGDLIGILATPEFAQLFQTLIDGATQLAPLITSIFTSLFDLLGKIAQAAMPYVVAGFQAIAGWLQDLSENTSVKDISDFLAMIVPHLLTWVNLAGQLAPLFFDLILAIAPYGQQLATAIANIARDLAKWLGSEKGREDIKKFFEEVVPAAIQFMEDVRNIVGAIANLTTFVNNLISKFRNAWNAVDNFLQKLDEGQQAVEDWINGAVADLVGFFGSIDNMLANAATSIWHAAVNLGKTIIQGLVKGIKSAPDAIKDAVGDAVQGGIDKAWDLLKPGSPSKVFLDLGEKVTQGYELGIRSGANRVARATGRMIATPVVMGPTAGGTTIQRQVLNLPPAPGHDQLGDPRVQAEMFAREMARRGQGVL